MYLLNICSTNRSATGASFTVLGDVPCHRGCGTLRNSQWQWVKICCLLPVMVTSPYEWNILEANVQTNQHMWTFFPVEYATTPNFGIDDQGVMNLTICFQIWKKCFKRNVLLGISLWNPDIGIKKYYICSTQQQIHYPSNAFLLHMCH